MKCLSFSPCKLANPFPFGRSLPSLSRMSTSSTAAPSPLPRRVFVLGGRTTSFIGKSHPDFITKGFGFLSWFISLLFSISCVDAKCYSLLYSPLNALFSESSAFFFLNAPFISLRTVLTNDNISSFVFYFFPRAPRLWEARESIAGVLHRAGYKGGS